MSGSNFDTKVGNVLNKFPAGLRVLVVDDDPVSLMMLKKMLKTYNYKVTTCNGVKKSISLLRENRNGYDIVLSDVHMPEMDGFKLLQSIEHEMDLPVVMMSSDGSDDLVMKAVTNGACDYLIKPICIEALGNIWQHVVRRRNLEGKYLKSLTSADDVDKQHQPVHEHVDILCRL